MPHSKPSRTSVASSLNRRSDSTVRLSDTTTPSRTSLALLLRVIVPARTMQAARHVADPRHPEDLANLGSAKLSLFENRLQHALERGLDFLDRLVDDRVV